jgi:hypothetical protein
MVTVFVPLALRLKPVAAKADVVRTACTAITEAAAMTVLFSDVWNDIFKKVFIEQTSKIEMIVYYFSHDTFPVTQSDAKPRRRCL